MMHLSFTQVLMDRITVLQDKLDAGRTICQACKDAAELGDVPPKPQCACGYAQHRQSFRQYATTTGCCCKTKDTSHVCGACGARFSAAAGKAAGTKAEKKEEKKAAAPEEDMGFSLFD